MAKRSVEDLELKFLFERYKPSMLYKLDYNDLVAKTEANLIDLVAEKQPIAKISQCATSVNFTRGGNNALLQIKKDFFFIDIAKAHEQAEKYYEEYQQKVSETEKLKAEREA